MSKPYTFLAYGINDSSSSAAAASSTVDGQNRCQGKNLMVSCNRYGIIYFYECDRRSTSSLQRPFFY